METKLTRNIQPNNKSPFSWLSKIFKGIKTGWDAVGGVFKKFGNFCARAKSFQILHTLNFRNSERTFGSMRRHTG